MPSTVITPSSSSRVRMKHYPTWLNWFSNCFRPVCETSSPAGMSVMVIEEKPTLSPIHTVPPVMEIEEGFISKSTFEKDLFPHPVASVYLWNFFTRYSEKERGYGHGLEISTGQMADGAERIYAQITDKEQILFYVKVFANGGNSIGRGAFCDLLLCAHELGFVAQKMSDATLVLGSVSMSRTDEDGGTGFKELGENEWIQAVISSCFHRKDEMSVTFVVNWIQTHLPRSFVLLHKYVLYHLTGAKSQLPVQAQSDVGYSYPRTDIPSLISTSSSLPKIDIEETDSSMSTSGIRKRVSVTGIHPMLLWLLEVSLPSVFTAPLEYKPGPLNCPFTKRLTSQELLEQLRHEGNPSQPWCQLYDSSEEGTSVNRFQLHLYHYKGPTLIFIFAQNGYTLCLGSDEEWKESSKFWGGEDSFLVQLTPEFRFVERGAQIIYTNFTVRGYPFGIQVGKDRKNLGVNIKPDFELVTFKGIPCEINRILAFGCGPKEIKNHQSEYKKWENKQCELQRSVPKRNRSEWSEDTDNYLLGLGGLHTSYVTSVSHGDLYTHVNPKTPLRLLGLVRKNGASSD